MATDFKISTAIGAIDKLSGPVAKAARTVASKLGGALKGAAGAAARASSAIAGTVAKLGALGLAAGGAAVAGGAALGASLAGTAAELSRTSRLVGVSVEDLQKFGYAARSVGVEGDQFTDSIKELSVRFGELRSGGGPLASTLESIGAKGLRKQLDAASSTGEAFKILIAAMAEVKDPAARAFLATQAFGDSGARLALLAAEGGKSLAELSDEAGRMGITSTATAKQAETLAQTFEQTKSKALALVGRGLAPLLPRLTALADRVSAFVDANGELIGQAVDRFFETVGEVIDAIPWDALISAVQTVIETLRPLVTTIVNAFRDNWGTIGPFLSELWSGIMITVKAAVEVITATVQILVDFFGPAFSAISDILSGFAEFFEGVFSWNLDKSIEGLRTMFSGFSDFFGALWDAIVSVFEVVSEKFGAVFAALAPDSLKGAWQAFRDFFASLWEGLVSIVTGAVDTIMGAVQLLKDAVDAISGAARTVGEALGLIDEAPTYTEIGPGAGIAGMLGRAAAPSKNAGFGAIDAARAAGTFPFGGGAAGSSKSTVEVTFKNAPPGMTVDAPKTTGGGEVKTSVGRRLAGAGALL